MLWGHSLAGRVAAGGGRSGLDPAVLRWAGPAGIGLDLDGRKSAVVLEYSHVTYPQAVGQVVQDRKLVIPAVGLLDAREFACPAGLAGECAGRRILAKGDDVLALEPEHPPSERVANTLELADKPLAHVPP